MSRSVARHMGLPQRNGSASSCVSGRVSIVASDSETLEGAMVASWIREQLTEGLPASAVAPGESTFVSAESVAVLARSSAALAPTREELDRLGIAHASASTPDDWVTSPAARVIVELVGFKGNPDHPSIRRRMAQLCGHPEAQDWKDAEELFQRCGQPDIAGPSRAASVEELISALGGLDIEDPDWPDDLRQVRGARTSFSDLVPSARRSFAEFKHHIARCQRGNPLDPGVRLLTIHKSQGNEFKSVAVAACNDGQFPDFRATTPGGIGNSVNRSISGFKEAPRGSTHLAEDRADTP